MHAMWSQPVPGVTAPIGSFCGEEGEAQSCRRGEISDADVPASLQKKPRLARDAMMDSSVGSSALHAAAPGWGSWQSADPQRMPTGWPDQTGGVHTQLSGAIAKQPRALPHPNVDAFGQAPPGTGTSSCSSAPHYALLGPPLPNVLPTQTQENEAEQAETRRYTGRIRKFQGISGGHGYGFIECPEMRVRTGLDVYLHAKQTHGCHVGEEVSFTVVFNAKGEPQARNLVRAEDLDRVKAKEQKKIIQQQLLLNQKRGGSSGIGMVGIMDEEQAKQFQKALKRKS